MRSRIGPDSAPDKTHRCGNDDKAQGLCGEPAVMHVLARDHNGELCRLASCAEHYPEAAASGAFVQAHEFGGWCGLPGSRWHTGANECVLDDAAAQPCCATGADGWLTEQPQLLPTVAGQR